MLPYKIVAPDLFDRCFDRKGYVHKRLFWSPYEAKKMKIVFSQISSYKFIITIAQV